MAGEKLFAGELRLFLALVKDDRVRVTHQLHHNATNVVEQGCSEFWPRFEADDFHTQIIAFLERLDFPFAQWARIRIDGLHSAIG